MRKWIRTPKRPQRLNVLLFDQFSNHCLANAIEPLRAANTLAQETAFEWRFLSLDGAAVTSSSGLPVQASSALSNAETADALLVISSYGFLDHATPDCQRALRAASHKHTVLVGLDTGSWLLAAAGLLEARRATIHWDEADAFQETFPEVDATRARLVLDGDRWSCGGGMTAFDLALRMIARTQGEALRVEVEALFMAGQSPRSGRGDPMPQNAVVSAALGLMRDNLEEPMAIPQIAAALSVSVRRLEALFRADIGATPLRTYRRLRLASARRLVEQTGLSVHEIALRCGYEDPSAMTRAFRDEFSATPSDLRKT